MYELIKSNQIKLLNHLRRDPRSIITYMDGSQLGTAMGAGYTIPTGFPEAINAIVLMGNTWEVFDAELRAIYECLLTCRNHVRIHHLRVKHQQLLFQLFLR
jgi:hypothetical protein